MSTTNGHPGPPSTTEPDASRSPGLSDLIREAEALHAELGAARARTARLVAGLRRHRRRTRAMNSAMAALKQLRLPEVEAIE